MCFKPGVLKILLGLICGAAVISCSSDAKKIKMSKAERDFDLEKAWSVELPDVAIYSSPRVSDLNKDGIKDFVFGAGKSEMVQTDIGVVAVDGANGEIMWILPARDEVFGSANFIDINNDNVDDILIGGRSAILYAVNGNTGEIIWEFFPDGNPKDPGEEGLYNFYNPQFIADQNNNGTPDILISNGGDVTVAPYDPDRPPGRLMIIDSKTGDLIAEAEVPDGKETYMSVVGAKLHEDDDTYAVIFGTGGETIGGNLYRTTLNDILNEDLSDAVLLDSSENHGFVAPPVLVDLNEDNYLDIVVNAAEGKIIAFNGRDNSVLWQNKIQNTEAYSSISVGNFISKNKPDLFTIFSTGEWPALRDNQQLLIKGDTGEILLQDTLGIYQTASPVVADFDDNGFDDALVSVNIPKQESDGSTSLENKLMVYDFRNEEIYQLYKSEPGANIASTPWIGDYSNNNKLDIAYPVLSLVYSQAQDGNFYFGVKGFKMNLLQSQIDVNSDIHWGSYMGSQYNGIYNN